MINVLVLNFLAVAGILRQKMSQCFCRQRWHRHSTYFTFLHIFCEPFCVNPFKVVIPGTVQKFWFLSNYCRHVIPLRSFNINDCRKFFVLSQRSHTDLTRTSISISLITNLCTNFFLCFYFQILIFLCFYFQMLKRILRTKPSFQRHPLLRNHCICNRLLDSLSLYARSVLNFLHCK